MKTFIVAVCIFACALASEPVAQVLRQEYEQSPSGEFQYGYEADNGIVAQAAGKLKDFGKGEVALEVSGSNSYTSADGHVYSLSYVADENGYRPQADYLPTPPAPAPIPEHILRALEYIAAHPYTEKKL